MVSLPALTSCGSDPQAVTEDSERRDPHQAEVAWAGSMVLLRKLGARNRAELQAHGHLSHGLASCHGTLGEIQDNASFARGQDTARAGCGW